MIVTIDARVFSHPATSQLELLALLCLCKDTRHCLVVSPPFNPEREHPLDTWLTTLPAPLRAEVRFALENGEEAASQRTTKAPRIRVVHSSQSRWDSQEPALTVSDALHLLRRPLKLLVENRRNDGAFLSKMAPPSYAQILQEALAKGWIEIENGGGLGELHKRLESAWARQDMIECGRMWVMVDSDARAPGNPSEQVAKLQNSCREIQRPWPVHTHVLERRSIENYLPVKSLQGWASLGGHNKRQERRDKADSFATMKKKSEQRAHHYNMKHGLLGDLPAERREHYRRNNVFISDTDMPPLFQGLEPELAQHLQEGFGHDIGDLFQDGDGYEWVSESHLQADVPNRERLEIIQSIIDRI